MVDPVTGTAVVLTWAGRRVIGPVLDRIGDDLADRYSDYRAENAREILETAERKLGDRASEEGEVPPRVVKAVLDEGSWSEAEVMAEYFGGILAASRTPDGIDDRGASLAGLVSRLSTHDVYLHYLIYEALRRVYVGRADLKMGRSADRSASRIYLRGHSVLSAMGLLPTPHNWLQFVLPSADVLLGETLVGDHFIAGEGIFVRQAVPYAPDEVGLMVTPSLAGIQLFLWAHGYRQPDMNLLIDPGTDFFPVTGLGSVADAQEVAAMQPLPSPPAS